MVQQNSDLPVSLREGETVLVRGVISQAIFWKAAGILMIAVLISIVAPPLGVFLSFVAFLTASYELLLKKFLLLVVTNERIFIRSGLIKTDTVQVRLERVESVEIQRTLSGYLLGYGTVVLTGTGTRFSFIPYLANAAEIRNVIDDLLYQREKKITEK
jgi:uncharacterized membrane protein YdbT with pleckstrin-like domain